MNNGNCIRYKLVTNLWNSETKMTSSTTETKMTCSPLWNVSYFTTYMWRHDVLLWRHKLTLKYTVAITSNQRRTSVSRDCIITWSVLNYHVINIVLSRDRYCTIMWSILYYHVNIIVSSRDQYCTATWLIFYYYVINIVSSRDQYCTITWSSVSRDQYFISRDQYFSITWSHRQNTWLVLYHHVIDFGG